MSKKEKTTSPPSLLDKPENVKRLMRGFYVLCGFLVLIDLIFSFGWHKHAAFAEELGLHRLEILPSFYGAYGFIGCAGLVYLTNFLMRVGGKKMIEREEDYWEK